MKFATILHDKVAKTVLQRGGRFIDLAALANRLDRGFPETAFPAGRAFIEAWVQGDHRVHEVLEQAHFLSLEDLPTVEPATTRYLPVVPNPRQVLAVGLNYLDHCREQDRAPPEVPMLFAKLPSCLAGHREPIVHWPITRELDYEGEVAVVIGRGGRGIPEAQALKHCFGFSVMNDVTARDLQRGDRQWVRGKGLDTFGPLGPVVVTLDEIQDPQALRIRTWVNGELCQDGSTADMIFSFSRLVAFASEAITLKPGDIITTGTPAGVGVFATPPRFLQPGDEVRIAVDCIGELVNPVQAP